MKREALVLVSGALFVAGCHTDMWAQPQTRALEPNQTFSDDQSARVPPPGSIAFSSPDPATPYQSGLENGQPVQVVPIVQAERALKLKTLIGLMQRGRERFDIFCSPCHGRLGDGHGMIAQRGFQLVRQPRDLHSTRVVSAPDGHIFRVITHGYGAMYSYDDRIPVADRWAIVAYIRALELSQGAKEGAPNAP